MFAIIEHKQKMSSTNGASDRLRRNLAGDLQPERGGYRGRHEVGVGHRGQLDDPPPIFKVGEEVTDGFDGERGLPDATGARQGHHPIGGDEVSHKLRKLRSDRSGA